MVRRQGWHVCVELSVHLREALESVCRNTQVLACVSVSPGTCGFGGLSSVGRSVPCGTPVGQRGYLEAPGGFVAPDPGRGEEDKGSSLQKAFVCATVRLASRAFV